MLIWKLPPSFCAVSVRIVFSVGVKFPFSPYHDDSAAALQKLPHEGNVLVAATAVRKKEDQKTDPFHIRFAQMLFYSYFGLLPDRIAVFFKYFWDILSGRFYIPLIPSTGGQISTEYQDVRLLPRASASPAAKAVIAPMGSMVSTMQTQSSRARKRFFGFFVFISKTPFKNQAFLSLLATCRASVFLYFATASTIHTIVAATESQNRMAKAVETAKYSFLGNRKSRITESSSTAAEQSVHLHCRKKAVKL